MGRGDLTTIILQDITHRALQHSRSAAAVGIESRRVLAQLAATSARFDADHSHGIIAQARMKQSNRIRSTADAGNQASRQTSLFLKNLRARFSPDDALKIAHH